jgi:hypothetical protein
MTQRELLSAELCYSGHFTSTRCSDIRFLNNGCDDTEPYVLLTGTGILQVKFLVLTAANVKMA